MIFREGTLPLMEINRIRLVVNLTHLIHCKDSLGLCSRIPLSKIHLLEPKLNILTLINPRALHLHLHLVHVITRDLVLASTAHWTLELNQAPVAMRVGICILGNNQTVWRCT